MYPSHHHSRAAFTLIELLVVIAIIAILAVVVVLTLNPAELLRQSRDANRVSDMATLTSALNLYLTDQSGSGGFSLGAVSSTGISVPDNTSSTCGSLGLPSLNASSGQQWYCASSTSSRSINNQGWIPVNLSKITAGTPIGSLPVDPTNQTSSGLFYAYNTNGTQFEITANLESQKYKSQFAQNANTNLFPEVISGGTPTISALYSPSGLVGYWPMDEGSGTVAYDQSGNGDNGTWGTWSAGNYYSSGKVGNYAGHPNSNSWVNLGNPGKLQLTNAISVFAWVNRSSIVNYDRVVSNYYAGVGPFVLFDGGSGKLYCSINNALNSFSAINTFNIPGVWYHVGCTYDGTTLAVYINGAFQASSTGSQVLSYSNALPWGIGAGLSSSSAAQNVLSGSIDDVRIYNRALSPAEILALYNAQK